jgi:hypothetical protein
VADAALRLVGVGYVYGASAEISRTMGQSEVASALEVVGRVEILLIAVPYIKEIITLGAELI